LRTAVEDLGLRALKLHCSVGDYSPTDERLDPVWSYAEEVSLPVVVHAGHSVLGTTDADELGPVEEVARRHPGARIIIAHCGHEAVEEAVRLLDTYPNVHADLTPVVVRPVGLSANDAARLSHKLLFGTDAPNTSLAASACLAHLGTMQLGPDQLEAITGGNARRLVAAVGAA